MVTLHSVYELMCSETTIHKGYIQPYTMPETVFYSRIFSADLKENFAFLLNHEHYSFQPESFSDLAQKERCSQRYREEIVAYFADNPSAIETLLQTSQLYLSEETSTICWDRYAVLMKRWAHRLPLRGNSPVKAYILNACDTILQYQVPITWMLLEAFSTSPQDLSVLYERYSAWNSACSSPAYLTLLKMGNLLRQLYTHTRKALDHPFGDRNEQYASLCREFQHLEAFYEQNILLLQEKNYKPLLDESLRNFHHFLMDFQKKSCFSIRYLEFMQRNLEQLEERLSKYP